MITREQSRVFGLPRFLREELPRYRYKIFISEFLYARVRDKHP